MDAQLRVEVSTWKTADSRDAPTIVLQVVEDASGEVVAEVRMGAGEWLHILTGSSLVLPGFVTNHPERLGKRITVRQESVPKETARNRADESVAATWARSRAIPGEESTVRLTNSGWKAIHRSWS